MSQNIIDILTSSPGQAQTFVVNTGATPPTVSLLFTGTNVLCNANGKKQFTQGDNFNVLSAGVSLPFAFGQGQNAVISSGFQFLPYLEFDYSQVGGGGGGPLPGFQAGQIIMPFVNYEMSIGQNVDASLIPFPFTIKGFLGSLVGLQISMVGVPTSLNGITFSASVFLKVQHNIALI